MGNFMGGSAFAMARQMADGVLLVTERTYRRMMPSELDQLRFEIEKLLREIRSQQPALDDLPAVQLRNRKIQRLNSSRLMLQAHRQRMRR